MSAAQLQSGEVLVTWPFDRLTPVDGSTVQESGAGQPLATVSPRRPAGVRHGAAGLPPVHGDRVPQRRRPGHVDRDPGDHHRRPGPAPRPAIAGRVTGSETTNDATISVSWGAARRERLADPGLHAAGHGRLRRAHQDGHRYVGVVHRDLLGHLLRPRGGRRVGDGPQREGHRPGRDDDARLLRTDPAGGPQGGTQLASSDSSNGTTVEGIGTTTLNMSPPADWAGFGGTCSWTHHGRPRAGPDPGQPALSVPPRCRSRSTPATSRDPEPRDGPAHSVAFHADERAVATADSAQLRLDDDPGRPCARGARSTVDRAPPRPAAPRPQDGPALTALTDRADARPRRDVAEFRRLVHAGRRRGRGRGARQAAVIVDLVLVARSPAGTCSSRTCPAPARRRWPVRSRRLWAGCSRRVQFTPDLLPSDVTGTSVYDPAHRHVRFRPGPVFANVVLADEINRAAAKTQSALLEVMEERTVTVDGGTHPVPDPFLVIATQNPIDLEGTYRLPEAQLDRFLSARRWATRTPDEVEVMRPGDSAGAVHEVPAVTNPDEVCISWDCFASALRRAASGLRPRDRGRHAAPTPGAAGGEHPRPCARSSAAFRSTRPRRAGSTSSPATCTGWPSPCWSTACC